MEARRVPHVRRSAVEGHPGMQDAVLVNRVRAGDRSAFAGLVDRYRDVVVGTAYHYLGNFEDAQDAAQEAFILAYRHLDQLRDSEKFGPWLRRLTLNRCADLWRAREGAGTALSGLPGPGSDDAPEDIDRAPAAHTDDAIEQLATRMVVREALNRLSEKTRLTVTLFYISGYSHAEIAAFLEIPVNTVRSRLQHAKRQLREEMRTMLTDVMHEGKPDSEFTRRVVEEAMRQGEAAMKAHASGEAIRHYDEALSALTRWEPGAEQRRLKMEALGHKADATRFPAGDEEARKLYEESLAIAEELGDRKLMAEKLMIMGCRTHRPAQKAIALYERALKLYEELGDAGGQGECLFWLGSRHVVAKEAAPGRKYFERALPLLEVAQDHGMAASCCAALDIIAQVGEERFPGLVAMGAACDQLEAKGGVIRLAGQPGIGATFDDTDGADPPPDLLVGSVFCQLSRSASGCILDPSAPVDSVRQSDSESYSYQPLRTTTTVKSRSERVTVPAGNFENCLLIEQVTTEGDAPDDALDRQRQLNRDVFCGTRRAWWGPGVGLVQLDVEQGDGKRALIQLREFSVREGDEAYLPLAIGNTWSYGWADTPEEWVAKEAYRVRAHAGEVWYLEQYQYLYRR